MAEQYWIGGFFIDLSRNQITQNQQSQTLAPKALAVLTFLAENQGKVVSHDALLANVWQDTVVSPNTLQKSIAQLRKALGDDGKVQVYIKTHAKKGYSLECDVRWQETADRVALDRVASDRVALDRVAPDQVAPEVETSDSPQPHSPKNAVDEIDVQEPKRDTSAKKAVPLRWGLFAVVGLILLVGYPYLAPKPSSPISFSQIRSLTATDDKEFDATYTPDGQYIVFHRYLDKLCVNKVWAKNIETQKETQLTLDWGAYGSHSVSKDGKKLVFLATEACTDSSTQTSCYDLVSLDFDRALESPQVPSLMLRCENSVLSKPLWIGNDDIAMLQLKSSRWKLIKYSVSENKCKDLYEAEDGNLVDYCYSARDDLIAVTRFQHDGRQTIDMLSTDGRLLSSHPIKVPPEIPKYRPIYPNFAPMDEQLIFSTGKQLFTLSYEGEVAKINTPLADRVGQPEFHPDGKRLLMLKGPYDSDIVLRQLDRFEQQSQPYASFERSNLGEDYATFQPGGNLIAFWSRRSGEEQVWISDGQESRQLTQFPMDTYIRGIEWAEDGQSLLVNANSALYQVFLDSNQKSFPLDLPIILLYQWDSTANNALLLVRIQGVFKLVECNLTNFEMRELTDRAVLWARKSEDGRLIYKDTMGRFWQPGPAEDRRIKVLDKQSGRAKSFVMHANVIYGISKEGRLWSYDLVSESFNILGQVGPEVDYLTDVNQTQLLMTVEVAAKKELVELSLSE
ncbi:Winged helix-turn-helix domain-containing protein [Sulfidibacter corallicola]|uniref:Winged helix-turn-helix domain-containing protein n=1 Tax=Sulfidibacter corallicola TaxID=2818388 RepID=A0A8A4TLA3_SULCO|nr:winged helix-turn-helix domain-containing protein [Sulfidibacter corallicola]QTD49902.1 winged helix-turn-helix domain-containing protein [Sulfidibacter corallicola]